ncbi:hypothetical protein BDY21DRAFT_335827 [Lineolata rhizophorae]|uniref:Centrosomin N-terminal motif 1 domain-containing protein n=1 Tax=Lineolata rhizophorae TaxID=578093 RepID=A0A6A6P9X5_9PEZI|nr:hypothetical protein BDY21DRAFT_335827 [Lineolata rhizophorae]
MFPPRLAPPRPSLLRFNSLSYARRPRPLHPLRSARSQLGSRSINTDIFRCLSTRPAKPVKTRLPACLVPRRPNTSCLLGPGPANMERSNSSATPANARDVAAATRSGTKSPAPAFVSNPPVAKSELLREALREKRIGSKSDVQARRGSWTPKPTTPKPAPPRDDWIVNSEEEERSDSARSRHHHRRASTQAVSTPRPSASTPKPMASKEADAHMDKLSRENFDLKLRMYLQQERIQKMQQDLDEALDKLESLGKVEAEKNNLEEENQSLEVENEALRESLDAANREKQETLDMNDELVRELEKRDAAVEEAAGIIHGLEEEVEVLRRSTAENRVGDSDYFSGEADNNTSHQLKTTTSNLTASRPSSSGHGSDYFSATSMSPHAPFRTPRSLSRRGQIPQRSSSLQSMQHPDQVGSNKNRHSLHAGVSVGSLASSVVSEQSKAQCLAARTKDQQTFKPVADLAMMTASRLLPKSNGPALSRSPSKPLRSLYRDGQIKHDLPQQSSANGPHPQHLTPHKSTSSDTPASSLRQESSPNANPDDDVFSTDGTPSLQVPSTASSPTLSSVQNFGQWAPPEYPRWPPPGGLLARDFLFNGDGLDDFPRRWERRG